MSENFFVLCLRLVDPPKSPFLRGVRGDQKIYLILKRHPFRGEEWKWGFPDTVKSQPIA